jgi:hypothetical protein
VPDLRLDGERPTSKDLLHRLVAFWLPSQPIVYIGSTPGSVSGRLTSLARTAPGDRKPAASAFWLQFLRNLPDLRVWWAGTDAPEEYEDGLLDAFAPGPGRAPGTASRFPSGEPGHAGDPAMLPGRCCAHRPGRASRPGSRTRCCPRSRRRGRRR